MRFLTIFEHIVSQENNLDYLEIHRKKVNHLYLSEK